MDLRSIINTEAGDSPSFNQTAPLTPVNAKPLEVFESYGFRLDNSPSKQIPQEYGAQQTNIPLTSIYQQNYQNRRPPLPPIQVSTPSSLKSPGQSLSANSPYRTTPSSTTTQLPFLSTQHSPQSPSYPHQYISIAHQEDSFQHSNSHHIHLKDTFNQSSSPLQSSTTNIPGAPHFNIHHQRSQSSVSASNPSSEKTHQKYSNHYSQDSFALEGSKSSVQSHIQSQQPRRPKSSASFCGSLDQKISSVSPSRPSSSYKFNIPLNSHIQNQQNSPVNSAPGSISLASGTTDSHDSVRLSLTEQDFRRNKKSKDSSLGYSPKTRQSASQKIDSSPNLVTEQIYFPGCKMEEKLDKSIKTPSVNNSDSSVISKGSHLITSRDSSTGSMPTNQPPRKRTRYKEPPIWARSVRTHCNASMINQDHSRQLDTLVVDQATPTPTQVSESRAKQNGNAATVTHSRASMADSHPSSGLGNWEESITGVKPIESITKVVADFIYLHVVTRGDIGELSGKGVQIEIEAKLGELIDKDTNQRYLLPVCSECVLAESSRIGFKSTMTEFQHQKLNKFLNDMVSKAHSGHLSAKPRVKIDYLHRREVDKFYELPTEVLAALPSAIKKQHPSQNQAKMRVTYDQASGNVLAKIIKTRIVSLDIYGGLSGPPDCRISINLETPFENGLECLVPSKQPDRIKDRLSYTQSYYQIDLTQVTQNVPENNNICAEKRHELEIEISTDALLDHGRRAGCGKANQFLSLIEGFLNNVRILSRFVAEVR